MDLQVCVFDQVKVLDLFGEIRRTVRRVIHFARKDQPKDKRVVDKEGRQTNAPPTLGVHVTDNIKVKPVFGRP